MFRSSTARRAIGSSYASRPRTQNSTPKRRGIFWRRCIPRRFWMWRVESILVMAVLLAGCRQDMHNQPRYKPYAETGFFGDGRSERPPVEGTVARGKLRLDAARFTGKVGGNEVDTFPFPIAKADLLRGQE